MCVNGDILIRKFERIMKLTCFLYFRCGFKIKLSVMYEYVMNNQEHVKNAYSHLRKFKHIQGI